MLKYGLTTDQFAEQLALQGGVCAVCRRESERWTVDHDRTCCPGDFTCGRCVRGILCRDCNVGLGIFADDMDRLRAAVAYLERAQDDGGWMGQLR